MECGCPGGLKSLQSCNGTGTAFEPCSCGSGGSGMGGGGPDAASGASGGQGGTGSTAATGGVGGVSGAGASGGIGATGGSGATGGTGATGGGSGATGGTSQGGSGGTAGGYTCYAQGKAGCPSGGFAYLCSRGNSPASSGGIQCQPVLGLWCCTNDICVPTGSKCTSQYPPTVYSCATSTSASPPGCVQYSGGLRCCP